ncbi:MAG: hypothetical protein VXW65_07200 [Pseudomonadota bacterium]|nr:hypothetical protein [Pseudomonadota bacterium]
MRVELSGSPLAAGSIWQLRLRTDMVPCIASAEMMIIAHPDYDHLLHVGGKIKVGGWPMTIIKYELLQSNQVNGMGAVTALHKVTANLTETLPAALPASRALGLENCTVASIYRAIGMNLSFASDIRLPRFNLSQGEVPSLAIAKRLQEEGAVIYGALHPQTGQRQLFVQRIEDLLQQPSVAGLVNRLGVGMTQSPMIEGLTVPNAYSADVDGEHASTPQQVKHRLSGFAPNRSGRELRNLGKVLVRRSVQTIAYDPRLRAGQVLMIGDQPQAILTCAHVLHALPARPIETFSMLWLADHAKVGE